MSPPRFLFRSSDFANVMECHQEKSGPIWLLHLHLSELIFNEAPVRRPTNILIPISDKMLQNVKECTSISSKIWSNSAVINTIESFTEISVSVNLIIEFRNITLFEVFQRQKNTNTQEGVISLHLHRWTHI